MYFSTVLSVVSITGVCLYLGIMGYMYFSQRSMVFPGAEADEDARTWVRNEPDASPWAVTMDDGITLEGAFLDRGPKSAIVLYFSGNAEDAVSFIPEAATHLPHVSVAALNYRGYGKSQGEPTEDALKHDALAIFDALRQTAGDRPVIVFGRSLGTALAAYTAARRSVQLVIILTPFDSIAAVGQGHYPWLPVRLLLQHDFDVCADARRIHATTLFLIAEEDRTTPPPRAHSIMQEWAAPKTSVVLEGARHNDIIDHPQYWTNIATFLSHSS